MNTIRIYDKITARVKLRESYEGRALKPKVLELEGKTLRLTVLWRMGEDDLYPGEFALGPHGLESTEAMGAADLTWIASGDVEVIEQ